MSSGAILPFWYDIINLAVISIVVVLMALTAYWSCLLLAGVGDMRMMFPRMRAHTLEDDDASSTLLVGEP